MNFITQQMQTKLTTKIWESDDAPGSGNVITEEGLPVITEEGLNVTTE